MSRFTIYDLRFAIAATLILAVAAGAALNVRNEATNVSIYFYVTDPNGDPNTAIAITDLDIYYVEQGSAISAKVDMTALAAADSAHSDNKGFNVGQGILRVDFPDAAFDGGVGKIVELIIRDVTGATDDGQKDKICPVTVQLDPPVNVAVWDGNDITKAAWNTTSKMLNVDVNFVREGAPIPQVDVNQAAEDAVATIKTVTDQIATMLTPDGANYKFTADATQEVQSADLSAITAWLTRIWAGLP